jgi:hypothetical protein
LYASRSWPYAILKLLLKTRLSWSNTPSPNQHLSFTFDIPSSPYINNDDNNNSRAPTLKITFELSNGIHIKKYEN